MVDLQKIIIWGFYTIARNNGEEREILRRYLSSKEKSLAQDLHKTCTRLAQNHVQNGSAKRTSSKCTKTGLKPYDFNPVFVSFPQEFGLSDTTWTCGLYHPNWRGLVISCALRAFMPFPLQDTCSPSFFRPLFPRVPCLSVVKTVVRPLFERIS